ncbi:MAG: MFS transporter [Pseudomonadota bacterium]
MPAALRSFLDKFLVLLSAPRELWVIYFAKAMEVVSYGLVMTTITLWLSSDLGLTDARAGYVVAFWSAGITFFTLLVGSQVDAIGIRRAFLLGFAFCLVTRGVVASTNLWWIAIPFGLAPMTVGQALMIPVMTAGVKRYTNVQQRSIAFSAYYVLMNVGFLVAGRTFDMLRDLLGEHGQHVLPILGEVSTYRVLLLVAFAVTIPSMTFTWFLLRGDIAVNEEGRIIREEQPLAREGEGVFLALWRTVSETFVKTVRILVSVWSEPNFYRFLGFLTLIVFVRIVFYHMHYTFPKYGIRELGEGAPIGQLWGVLNPAVIILLVPLIGALSQKMTSYKMIAIGTSIAAAPVFLLAMPPRWFEPLAQTWFGDFIAHRWLGVADPVVNPLYVIIPLFVVIFSIGEAFWSPRLYEYTASIAPKGKVASYLALSLLPYFLASFVTGMFSGKLLEWFCPSDESLARRYLIEKLQALSPEAAGELDPAQVLPLLAEQLHMVVGPDGLLSPEVQLQIGQLLDTTYPRHSQTLWLIVAVMAAICPLGIITLRRFLRSHEEGRDEPLAKEST